jgi:hypothetical protein
MNISSFLRRRNHLSRRNFIKTTGIGFAISLIPGAIFGYRTKQAQSKNQNPIASVSEHNVVPVTERRNEFSVTLEKALQNFDTNVSSLTLRFQCEGKQCGPIVWADAFSRHDQYGRILEYDVLNQQIRLTIRILLKRRYSAKQWAPVLPGLIGEYVIELNRHGNKLKGRWIGKLDDEEYHGTARGRLTPAQNLMSGFVPLEPGEHPCLLLRTNEIPVLQKKAQTDWGRKLMERLKAQDQSRSNMAVGQGLLYLITGKRRYAEEAQRLLQADIQDRKWFPIGAIHDPAHKATEASIAYDLIHDACDEEFHKNMCSLLPEKTPYLYHFAHVVRANRNVASNWQAQYRSGSGMAALAMLSLGDSVEFSRPQKPELPKLKPPTNLSLGKEVPLVVLESNKDWTDWLYAGPFSLERGQDALTCLGGVANARPENGTKVTGLGRDKKRFEGVFRPVTSQYVITEDTPRAKDWQIGTLRLAGTHGPALSENKPFTTIYLYCVIENKHSSFYKIDQLEYQMDNPCVYIAGKRFVKGDYVYLVKGRFPVMVKTPLLKLVKWNHHDRGKICYRLRLIAVSKKEADQWFRRKNKWYEAELEEWQRNRTESPHPKAIFWLELARKLIYGWTIQALGEQGWNSEGEAYTQHSFRVVFPFAHCYRNIKGTPLGKKQHLSMALPLYIARTIFRKDGAVMHSYANGGGPLGVDNYARGFNLVPEHLKPAVLWGWNRTLELAKDGKLKSRWLEVETLDPASAAFMFINYPLDIKECNPGKLLPNVIVDEQKGGYVFRNRWKDGDDFVATIFLNKNYPGHLWHTLNTSCFRISGLSEDWVVRGASYSANGVETNRVYLPERKSDGVIPAKCIFFEPRKDGSGIISMDLSRLYSGIPAIRSFAVDYSGKAGVPGLFVVVDKISKNEDKSFWQLVTERSNKVTVLGNRFVIQSKGTNEATLQGTVVAPASPLIKTENVEHRHEVIYHGTHKYSKFPRTIIKVKGGEFFFIVMTVQRGSAPDLTVKGKGLKARVLVGKQNILFDGKKIIMDP